MAKTTADILIERLIDWEVEVIFGIPGDGINGIIEALRSRQDKIRFVQVRHEESAAFMATAYAKFTGRIGTCIATSGPGGLHLLNGLYDAKLDGAPVLAITGLPFHDLIGTHTQQDVELDKVFADACVFNQRIMGANHVEPSVDLACRTALARRGVAHLTIPVDIQEAKLDAAERSERNKPHHSGGSLSGRMQAPRQEELLEAARILNEAKRPVILVGQGARGAGAVVEAAAERLGSPIVTALLGKGVIDEQSPYATGGIGLLGTRPSSNAMERCDALCIVGSSFPYIEYLPKPGSGMCVQIDLEAARIGLRYPATAGLVGDAQQTMVGLLPLLDYKTERSFLESIQSDVKDWRKLLASRAPRDVRPMKPQLVASMLGERLADNAVISVDSGTITAWAARYIPIRRGQLFSCSGTLASMACALPYAIAAQTAYPHRQCVAFVGDGGLSMLMAELATCAKYQLPVKIVAISNHTLGQIKWEQLAMLGNPEFACDLQPIDFAKVAEACGIVGIREEDPARLGHSIDMLLSAPGPALLDAVVDPHEPPLPPTVTAEQAKHFAEAIARGTKHRAELLKTLALDRVRQLV